jgi:hypothetical protein
MGDAELKQMMGGGMAADLDKMKNLAGALQHQIDALSIEHRALRDGKRRLEKEVKEGKGEIGRLRDALKKEGKPELCYPPSKDGMKEGGGRDSRGGSAAVHGGSDMNGRKDIGGSSKNTSRPPRPSSASGKRGEKGERGEKEGGEGRKRGDSAELSR